MKREEISFRQFAAAGALLCLPPASRLLPKAALALGGKGAWATVVPAFGLTLLLAGLAVRLLRGERDGLLGLMESCLGKRLGKAAAALVGLWLVFYCGFIARSGAERLLSTVYESGELWFFLLSMGLVSMVPALGRLPSAFRAAELCALILGFSLAVLFAFALPKIRWTYLWPVNPLDAGGLALSVLPLLDVSSLWFYLCFLSGSVREGSFSRGRLLRPCALAFAAVGFLMFCTVGVLGPESAKRQQFPFFVMISNLDLFHVLERVEPLIVMIWVLTDFALIGLLLLSAGEIFRRLSGAGKRRFPALFCALGSLAVSFLAADSAFRLEWIGEVLVPIVNLSITLPSFPLLFLLKKLKKGEKRC